jgi:endo-1,3-1,4-beta-glycanase ExoK
MISTRTASGVGRYHGLGRSPLDPSKVSVSNGKLQSKLPRRSLESGELVSNVLYGYGS